MNTADIYTIVIVVLGVLGLVLLVWFLTRIFSKEKEERIKTSWILITIGIVFCLSFISFYKCVESIDFTSGPWW